MFARKIFWIAAAAALCASLPVLSIHAAETAAAAESEQQEAKEYELDTTTFHMGTVVQIKVFGKTPEETKRFAQIVEDEVVRFDDTEVSMRTSRGMLTVHGEGLRVGRLAIDTGELAIDGAFDALDYTEETVSGSGFWSRLFGG